MSIDGAELVRALGLVMVLEGLLPFIAPARWQRALQQMGTLPPRSVRIVAALVIASGCVVLLSAT